MKPAPLPWRVQSLQNQGVLLKSKINFSKRNSRLLQKDILKIQKNWDICSSKFHFSVYWHLLKCIHSIGSLKQVWCFPLMSGRTCGSILLPACYKAFAVTLAKIILVCYGMSYKDGAIFWPAWEVREGKTVEGTGSDHKIWSQKALGSNPHGATY